MRIELSYKPWKHQREAHANLKRFNVFIWHRRGGKTEFCLDQLRRCAISSKLENSFFAYIAPKRNQAKTVAWDRLKASLSQIPGMKFNETELFALFPNGSKVRLFGADDPQALRGIHLDGVILDEVADMKPSTWGEVIRPALSDRGREGWAIFIGTPRGHNFLYEIYRAAQEDPTWHCDLRRASETGIISPLELEAARKTMSAAQFAQEYECDFGASADDAILDFEEVMEAVERPVDMDSYLDVSAKILGVDVARFGADKSVIIGRQGALTWKPKIFSKLDTMQLADQVAYSINKWNPDAVFIDVGGVGGGAVDRLKDLGFAVTGVQFGSKASDAGAFQNKRTEMWARMANWIREGGSLHKSFPCEQLLVLHPVSYLIITG